MTETTQRQCNISVGGVPHRRRHVEPARVVAPAAHRARPPHLPVSSFQLCLVRRSSVLVVAAPCFRSSFAFVEGSPRAVVSVFSLDTTAIFARSQHPRPRFALPCHTHPSLPPCAQMPIPLPLPSSPHPSSHAYRPVGHYTLFYHGLLIAPKRFYPGRFGAMDPSNSSLRFPFYIPDLLLGLATKPAPCALGLVRRLPVRSFLDTATPAPAPHPLARGALERRSAGRRSYLPYLSHPIPPPTLASATSDTAGAQLADPSSAAGTGRRRSGQPAPSALPAQLRSLPVRRRPAHPSPCASRSSRGGLRRAAKTPGEAPTFPLGVGSRVRVAHGPWRGFALPPRPSGSGRTHPTALPRHRLPRSIG